MQFTSRLSFLTPSRVFSCYKTPLRQLVPLRRQFTTSSDSPSTESEADIPIPISRRPSPCPDNAPLPLLLPPPAETIGRTTRRMLQVEAEQYLYPLYLRGWFAEDIRIRDAKDRRVRTPHLTYKKFYLQGKPAAHKAVKMILGLMEKEKHDINFELFFATLPELSLRLQTHSCRKWPPGKINEVSANITLNDIRFAVLFEQAVAPLLHEKTIRHRIKTYDGLSWDTFLSRFPYTDTYTDPSKKNSK